MNNKYTVFLILAILVIAFLWNKNEHLDVTPLSNEAIQSIASVYNKDNLTATNINATGYARLAGAKVTNGAGGDGFTWFNHPNGNNYIRGDNTYISGNIAVSSNIGATGSIQAGGNIGATGNLQAGGNIGATGSIQVGGNLQANGNTRLAGAKVTNGAGGDGFTWFNHPNGNNYIRGDNTYISGNLCFGGSDNLCLNAGNVDALLRNIGR